MSYGYKKIRERAAQRRWRRRHSAKIDTALLDIRPWAQRWAGSNVYRTDVQLERIKQYEQWRYRIAESVHMTEGMDIQYYRAELFDTDDLPMDSLGMEHFEARTPNDLKRAAAKAWGYPE